MAKAYEALTDDEAKRDWLEYGNPDGKQSLEVFYRSTNLSSG